MSKIWKADFFWWQDMKKRVGQGAWLSAINVAFLNLRKDIIWRSYLPLSQLDSRRGFWQDIVGFENFKRLPYWGGSMLTLFLAGSFAFSIHSPTFQTKIDKPEQKYCIFLLKIQPSLYLPLEMILVSWKREWIFPRALCSWSGNLLGTSSRVSPIRVS